MAALKRPKLTKQELRGPIAIQVKAQELWAFIEKNWQRVLIAAGSLAVLGLGIVGLQAWRESRAEAAAHEFSRGLETGLTPLLGEEGAPDPAKMPVIPGHDPVPLFNDPAARARAALAMFQKVRAEHGGSDVADLAVLASADMHYDLGDWDAAIADYDAFVKSEPADRTALGLAIEGLGAAYENKGDIENARVTFEKLGSEVPDQALMPDRRLYHLGRLAARAGDAAKAREYFNKLKTDFPASPLVVDVNTRLTLLDNPGLVDLKPPPVTAPAPVAPAGTAAPAAPGTAVLVPAATAALGPGATGAPVPAATAAPAPAATGAPAPAATGAPAPAATGAPAPAATGAPAPAATAAPAPAATAAPAH
jgi:tetratricopeptide (TPR) repeat protein